MKIFKSTKTFLFRDDSEYFPQFYILTLQDEKDYNETETLITHCQTLTNLRDMLNNKNIQFTALRIDEVTHIPSAVYEV